MKPIRWSSISGDSSLGTRESLERSTRSVPILWYACCKYFWNLFWQAFFLMLLELFLPYILKKYTIMLQKGYQLHVSIVSAACTFELTLFWWLLSFVLVSVLLFFLFFHISTICIVPLFCDMWYCNVSIGWIWVFKRDDFSCCSTTKSNVAKRGL